MFVCFDDRVNVNFQLIVIEKKLISIQIGDVIDAMDLSVGAWFEAEIVKVTDKEEINNNQEDGETASGLNGTEGGISTSNTVDGREEPMEVTETKTKETDCVIYHVRFEE